MRNTHNVHVKLFLLLAACFLSGCAQEKESLLEHEHDAPKHWPNDMSQAAEFIRLRVELLNESASEPAEELEEELRDLVEWAPEIAAETGLPEERWVPVYEMSEVIRKHLQSGDVSALDLSGDFEKLANLLDEAHAGLHPHSERTGDDAIGEVLIED